MKRLMIPMIFAGQSNFGRILKSPTLLTRSKALVRSINEMYIFHVIVWWIISNQQFNVCPGNHSVTQDKLPLQALGVALEKLKQFFSDGKECDALLVEAVSPVPMFAALMSYGTSTSCQRRQDFVELAKGNRLCCMHFRISAGKPSRQGAYPEEGEPRASFTSSSVGSTSSSSRTGKHFMTFRASSGTQFSYSSK